MKKTAPALCVFIASLTFMQIAVVAAPVAAAQTATPAAPAAPAAPQPGMRGDGPPPPPREFSITRSHADLDAIVAPDAKLELLASGFGLNEGPVWVREGSGGYLLVSGLLDNVIYRIAEDKTVTVFLDKAGYSGTDIENVGAQTRSGRSHVLLIGPSCTGLDKQGRLIWCADNDRTVMRLENDGTRTVLASGAGGKRFSGPNDISISSKDAIYLTDNDFGLRGAGRSPDKQMENAVWLIREGSEPKLLLTRAALGGIPNGVALSNDERNLYLSAQSKLMRYDVMGDGTLGAGSLFAEGPAIGDGIKVDKSGNVFSTGGAGPGTVRVMSKDGRLLGMINLPVYGGEPKRQICATNVAFGGNDGKSLYITACDAVYKVPLR
ncbi:MAG TPA: SMP-30/gluconolactonase/LRE family protein [Steroidobacteraceae bacterium]|nr:SMP-30/gluconolactonase/LRE family protein [Steroidobacteraceae bacterium]